MSRTGTVDLSDSVEFEPLDFSVNLFWQTNQRSHQKVYSIISNYLSTMNQDDIKTLCNKFGKNMVKAVLDDKYKSLYKQRFISTNGMDIQLEGKYNQNLIYKEVLGMINSI